jgi:type VI secretion system protein ImpE
MDIKLTPGQLFEAGRLDEALSTLSAELRAHPTDLSQRGLLAELLCFDGQLERADKQLELMGTQDPASAVGLALFRQLVRAAQARQDFFTQGRPPELLDTPSPALQRHLEASICLREADVAEANRLLREAEAARQPQGGRCDGQRFADFRDMDDLTAPIMELLTSTGKYFWVPLERIVRLQLRPPKRPRDLLWRPALAEIRDGPEGEVFLPVTYPAADDTDEATRLGRVTEWQGPEEGPTRGLGQKTFLVDDDSRALLEMGELEFVAPQQEADGAGHGQT